MKVDYRRGALQLSDVEPCDYERVWKKGGEEEQKREGDEEEPTD